VIDEGLPALARALEPAAMIPLLARAAGAAPIACSADVLAHKPGRRCTIAYELVGSAGERVQLVGKLYRRPRLAKRVYAWSQELAAMAAEHRGALVPQPVAYFPELGLTLHRRVGGADLRHALAAGDASEPLARSARWLAWLHRSEPLDELRVKPLEHELAKLERWCARVAPVLPLSGRARLAQARRRLVMRAKALGPRPLATIHRDLYYAHVLWDGRATWLIDLDQLSLGDPALDVGHFLAHLDTLALRTARDPGAYRDEGRAFVAAYRSGGGADVEAALPLYRAYTFVKLAATEVDRRGPAWREQTEALVELACAEVEERSRVGFSASTALVGK
jgi:aminoglycoside phosphotransferase (APT) family kinase protein